MQPRGRFITLEGGEGAGKSTQARLLAATLAAAGIPTLRTREPGGSPGAEAIRRLLLAPAPGGQPWDGVAETLLHFAARREHVARTIAPALAAGIWVISDRFADSTLAYQVHGQGVPRAVWDTLVGLTLEGLAPDLTIVLKLDAFEGLERVWDRTVLARDTPFGAAPHLDRYERLSLDFHQRVIESFNAIAEASPGRCAILSGSAGQEDVAAQIRGLISTRLGARLPP